MGQGSKTYKGGGNSNLRSIGIVFLSSLHSLDGGFVAYDLVVTSYPKHTPPPSNQMSTRKTKRDTLRTAQKTYP